MEDSLDIFDELHTAGERVKYGYRADNKKPLVTYRFLNLSSFLDLSPGVFI